MQSGFFSILSLSTSIIFWLLSVLALVLIVIFWHKFSVHNFKNIFFRVSLLILTHVLFISSILLAINRSGNFYETWSDLFGWNNDLSKIAVSPQNLANISQADIKKAEHTKGGSLIFKKIITGENSKVSSYVYVVLSPKLVSNLESSPNFSIGDNYQVVELFPGYPGVPSTWISKMHGAEVIEQLEARNKIPPTVAIVPAINVVPGLDTECLNIPGTSEVETWLTQDMFTFAQKFVGIDDRKWTSFGYSTGGWCAAVLGIRHQDQYNNAISIAGYFEPSFSAGVTKRERVGLKDEYDLIKNLQKGNNSLKLLAIYAKQQGFETRSFKTFFAKAQNLLPIKTVEIPEGGHNISTWRPYVYTGFEWLASNNLNNGK